MAWTPWEYADRSTGRWDDPQNRYRVLYTGSSPEARFTEILAPFRPDPMLIADSTGIRPDPRDELYPAIMSGVVPTTWLNSRLLGSAQLTGAFLKIADKATIAALRPIFLPRAVHYGLPDFDAGAIMRSQPRRFTQEISSHLYEVQHAGAPLDGIKYESRFGAGLALYAIYERATDEGLECSRLLSVVRSSLIAEDHPDLTAAMNLHGLALR